MRLSTRFAVCVALLVPLLVLLAGVAMLRLASHDLRAERDRHLTTRLRALVPMATVYARRARPISKVSPEAAAQRLAGAALGAEAPGGVYLHVPGADPFIIGNVPSVMPPGGAGGPATFTADGAAWRYVGADLALRGRNGDRAQVWVLEPEQRLAGQLDLLRKRLALVTLAAVAVGAAAGFALGRFAVRPLAVLTRQAQALDVPSGTAARLGTASGVSEIDKLAALVNELLGRRDVAVARTAEALEAARAFAATAAHELRTPLTSVSTNLTLLDHPDLDPAERAEIIADLVAEHGRMQRLIAMLRELARGELADAATFAAEVELTEIVATAAEEARRRHPHATITCPLDREVRVRGWEEGLRVIVDNLIDNAAIHGADDWGRADITVTLARQGAAALLAVQDAGPGIPAAERGAVFGRFHRRPGSPGSGLGLTLVHQQAERHGGTVTVPDPPAGTGTRIEVRLPMAGPAAVDRPEARSWLTAQHP
ncbi:sensor histidine kinase [Actinomadura sp. HBU206391]|uniref:sensor histidine kinase n=1 Tax=Actinomadura sp. HBU206391 TaxID=2731692 RepID=UPI00164F0CEF|nr:HAMP domain-containing sensor histidine kinase [Actinomadura sp. HBU206391]MBC6457851.1 HAMP domain-containing histidine kinase [Actinomadura sp. HBU206391]